jgi:hypothetical protein
MSPLLTLVVAQPLMLSTALWDLAFCAFVNGKYFGGPAEYIFRTEDSFKKLAHIYQTTRRHSRKTRRENRKPHKTALQVEGLTNMG